MKRQVILILGKQGSGKSTLAKKIIRRYSRVIVFDPLSEYHGGLVVRNFDEFASYFLVARKDFFVVCRFQEDSEALVSLSYEMAAKAVWELSDCLLVLEESEQFLDSQNRESFINYLISFGRHRKISLLGIGRRPTELAIKLRAQFTSIISFQQTEPNDLRYMEAIGFEDSELTGLEEYKYATHGEKLNDIQEEETEQEKGEIQGK